MPEIDNGIPSQSNALTMSLADSILQTASLARCVPEAVMAISCWLEGASAALPGAYSTMNRIVVLHMVSGSE